MLDANYAHLNKRRIEFTPPEAVTIHFTIASFGARLGAQILDLIITLLALYLLVLTLIFVINLPWSVAFFVLILAAFFIRMPYYVLSELVWNGRTLGKRIVGIRVINKQGRHLTPHQIVARNLMKEVEFFAPLIAVIFLDYVSWFWKIVILLWVSVLLIIVLANRQRQRLGDMVAGTIVVNNPRAKLLPDLALAISKQESHFDFLDHHLDIYGRFELQTLENILRIPEGKHDMREVQKITQTIIKKINYTEPVETGKSLLFLREFYRAQRAYLEKLRLFGNKRENKYHINKHLI